MKIFSIIFVLFLTISTAAQETNKKYFFKEIGWTISLPTGFKTIDSIENVKKNNRGLKAIEESNDISVDISELKTLIAATKDPHNYFNSTIRPFDPSEEGSYDSATKIVKDMLYKTFLDNIPGAKIDSVTTNDTIDGLLFDKFHVTITLNNNFAMNMFLLSKYYRGYDFGISYLYLDDETKEQIESTLRNSTFNK